MADNEESDGREKYQELLQELRTIIPGAQVLFAFLLTVPFAARFEEVDHLGKLVFTVSLLTVASATILFMAPAAYYRLTDHRDRPGRLHFGVKTALSGLFLIAVSITCSTFVVVRFRFESTIAGSLTAVAVAAFAMTFWGILPLAKRP
ncbi:DUF6328 family protein [Loktanella sp. SALINAS62]|uniref:DUF6328 family protein n=1 Tax=Loktanella sp. SALINAS62 TaxID=2706124 RepID=UPI001B8C4A8C|nr:DUF6328 family protein [Loktanella sp. SALINAS62]MBS1303412.1 hypothetical protein [Loktanella sp. SALINAS62]